MKYKMNVTLSNGKLVEVEIEKPELVYGATALIVGKQVDGYALNPVTHEKLEIMEQEAENTRLFITANIEKDYIYAKEHHLPIKQVVAPYFYGKGEETPRENKETQRRYSVVGVIKHHQDDQYLCEDAKGRNCKSFVMGGIEENETPEEACIREVYEETGYQDVEIDFVSNFVVVNHFYAGYKGVNRYAYLNFVYGHLTSDTHETITEEENAKHVVKWISKDDLKDFINIDLNKMALDILLHGEHAYTEDGIMMTNDENNEKPSIEVRNHIIQKLGL